MYKTNIEDRAMESNTYVADNSKKIQKICQILNIEILSEAAWPTAIGWSFEASTFTGDIRYTPDYDRLVFLLNGFGDPRGLTAKQIQSVLLANIDQITALFACQELSVDVVERFQGD